MRHGRLSWITGAALLALLTAPIVGLAQEQAQGLAKKHSRYTLVDIGTLGGPNSGVNGGSVIANKSGAVVGGADTPVYDPGCDCYISHAFEWRKGVLTDLGTLQGGAVSNAIAINSQGAVAGTSENGLIDPVYGLPAFVATIWKDGEIQDLGTLGGGFSLPNAINDRGQATGAAANTIADPDGFATALIFGLDVIIPGNQWHATLWQNGIIQDLGTLGDGPDSFAIAVNQRGQVAGFSFSDSVPKSPYGLPTVAPFLWDADRMINLGTLGGVFGEVTDLNNRGQVVGGSNLAGATQTELHSHAFLWEKGSLRDLGTVAGALDFSLANALNDNGEIIGVAATPDGAFRGFLWKRGVMTDLGSVAGDGCSNTSSINSKGQIVGESYKCEGGLSHAFLWENGGPAIDLNVFVPAGSDLHLKEALFISDRGEIAGAAILPNGDEHAFILIPAEGDVDDYAVSATATGPAASRSLTSVTSTRVTPERLTALRAQFANRNRGFGIRPPKSTR